MNQPTLYMMFGYPGAGKTTAADVIKKLTGAEHLSSDQLRSELFPESTFSQAEHDELYRTLDKKTEELLKAGKSVIYDANLNRHQHRQDKYDICRRLGVKSLLLWVQTPRTMAKQRAGHHSRQHLWPADETPDQLFDRIAEVIEEPNQATEPFIVIDGTKVTEDYVRSQLHTTN